MISVMRGFGVVCNRYLGVRRRLGGCKVVGLLVLLAASTACVKADNIAYEATGSDNFGTIDLTTGAYTQIGYMGALLSGLGVAGGGIYGGIDGGNVLYQVNPATGQLTSIGTSSDPGGGYKDFGSTTSGLYAIDASENLVSVNPTNGQATIIGNTGLSTSNTIGLSTNSSVLYYTDGTNLYTLNTSTGAPTLVGSTGIGIGAMVLENGVLYGGQSPVQKVVSIDPSTAAITSGPSVTNSGGTFWGLTPIVPLPTSLWGSLLLLGALATKSFLRPMMGRAVKEEL